MVLEDTDGDSKADKEWPAIPEVPALPHGRGRHRQRGGGIDDPDAIVYTDVDRNLNLTRRSTSARCYSPVSTGVRHSTFGTSAPTASGIGMPATAERSLPTVQAATATPT